MPDPTDCPPGWHDYRPPRSPPAPGQNPRYDELEACRRRYERLEQEAEQTLGYHDARRLGLVSNRDFYRAAKERALATQRDLLTPSARADSCRTPAPD